MKLLFLLTSIAALFSTTIRAESVTITLNGSSFRDPLVDFVQPIGGNGDVIRPSPGGVEIHQYPDKPDSTTTMPGMKVLFPAHGDFNFDLKLKCLKLDSTTSGWGQGIFFTVVFGDIDNTILNCGYVTLSGRDERRCAIELKKGVTGRTIQYKFIPLEKLDGVMTVKRVGKLLTFQLANADEQTASWEFEVPTDDVVDLGVWATRLPKGNTEAHYELSEIRLEADSLSPYVAPKDRGSWWPWLLAAQVLLLAGLFYIAAKARQEK